MTLPRFVRAVGRRLRRRLRRGLNAPPPHHRHHAFSEEELLARAEEFNRNAEVHWRAIAEETAGRSHVLNKPLSTVQDTGPILYRLGLVLTELHLGIGHTVLDFAAGSCWLSSYLNRLRCRTVAVDVSPTALELGKELFRLDPRHRPELEPQFLPYDGHRLPVPDESVDRVACFDAFHHVPNQDEVLREFHRVLKPGGRVVLAEPGEGHSHTDQSQFEMGRYGVLENDLHLEDIVKKARAAGFSEVLVKPYPEPSSITFPAADHLRFMAGEDGLYPVHVLRDNLRHFLVFVLAKGEETRDSRNPGVLRAKIELVQDPASLRGPAGETIQATLRLKNTGDSLWLHEKDDLGGYVMLGGHLYNEAREIVTRSFTRASLPRDVAPGETVEATIDIPLPVEKGCYHVRFDLVSEWLAWFEQFGSPLPEFRLVVDRYPDSRKPHLLRARIERGDAGGPLRVPAGAWIQLPLRLTNLADTIWLPATPDHVGAVVLGGHLGRNAQTLSFDFFRSPLPREVAPGESLEVVCAFAAPAHTGRYLVTVDLVAEGICWFEHHGSVSLPLEVEVTDDMPDSRNPGILKGEIRLAEGADILSAAAGARVCVVLRVTNTGNTLWRHEEAKGGGYVALGAHLRDEGRRLLAQDHNRTLLPRSLAPGESADLRCEVPMPERPGRYFLELDLVDQGIMWFAERGSPTIELELRVV